MELTQLVQYRGAYRYADRAALDHALAAALALADHADWRANFMLHGSSLRVLLDLPHGPAQSAAARVMERLALLAVEGIVVARHRDLAVDVFVCGE